MHRLAFRPVLRALRVQSSATRANRLAVVAVSCPFPARKYATTTSTTPTGSKQKPVKISAEYTKSHLDPAGVYTAAEYISVQLESPPVQALLSTLPPDDLAIYNSMNRRLTTQSGHADVLAINDIAEFLEERGVELDLPDKLFEPPNPKAFHETGEEVDYGFTEFKNPDATSHRSLMEPVPHLDARDVLEIPPSKQNPYGGRVTVRNHVSIFENAPAPSPDSSSGGTTQTYRLPMREVRNLYQSILISRTVKQQTGKGKIMHKFFLVLVGDGNGLVGYGQGKDFNARLALQKARFEAVKNMDWVERFEQRTVWTEMETALGATRLILRPRPVGFGLRCNPYLHQILRAAGFKDISAKVWGSRNKLNVIKAAFRMLHTGHAPVGMGDGLGGPGKKLSKGIGMQGKAELERARGRKLISLRK